MTCVEGTAAILHVPNLLRFFIAAKPSILTMTAKFAYLTRIMDARKSTLKHTRAAPYDRGWGSWLPSHMNRT